MVIWAAELLLGQQLFCAKVLSDQKVAQAAVGICKSAIGHLLHLYQTHFLISEAAILMPQNAHNMHRTAREADLGITQMAPQCCIAIHMLWQMGCLSRR